MATYDDMRDWQKAEILRKEKGLTQEDLGQAMGGLPKQRVSNYLQGKKVGLKIHQYMGLARILGISLDSLVDDGLEPMAFGEALPADEIAILEVYRAFRNKLDSGAAIRALSQAAMGYYQAAEPVDDYVPVPPPGIDPTYRHPLKPKEPLDGVVTRKTEPAELTRPSESEMPRRTTRRKPG